MIVVRAQPRFERIRVAEGSNLLRTGLDLCHEIFRGELELIRANRFDRIQSRRPARGQRTRYHRGRDEQQRSNDEGRRIARSDAVEQRTQQARETCLLYTSDAADE